MRSARRTALSEVAPGVGTRFTYEYDFGDNWRHEVLVEKVVPVDRNGEYPICLAGARACPPEDCGGTSGYEELLEAVRDSQHPEHARMLTWLGGYFDSEAFDLAGVNRGLRRLR